MAALLNTQHVSGFSPGGKLFAFINAEGKLKIWETETSELKQDYTPNLHLSAPCTCFTWLNVDLSAKVRAKKARKSLDHTESSLYIALGTNKGGVSLYSFGTGKIEQYLKGNGHVGSVTNICRGSDDILYTCGDDGQVIEWNTGRGVQINNWSIGVDKPTCLLYIPTTGNLLVAGRELKLWATDKKELKQTFTGHTSNVILLKNVHVNSTDFVLSASKMDRTISMWRIKSGSKYKNAAVTFLMADVAFFISCEVSSQDSLQIAAVTRSGVVHIFFLDDVCSTVVSKPIKPKITIEVASDAASVITPIPIITARLSFINQTQSILLGYGDRQFLRFEHIELDTSEKNKVLIRNDPAKVAPKSVQQSAKLKTITPIIGDSVEYQTPAALARKTKTIEIPMETRLENLSLSTTETPFAKNVVQLLIQGLHNHDSNVLKTVFATVDEKVIRLTLQRLPPQYVGSLVHELTLLTLKKTSNVQLALTWLRVLLQTHASQLMALGTNELFERFGPLIGVIEHRSNTYKPLSKLSGRLDLLACQIRRNTDDDTIENENLLIFEDQHSPESSDVESGNDDNSSDDQWVEDGDEENENKMDLSENEE